MTRAPLHRLVGWLMLGLLAFVAGDSLRGHECPVHAFGAAQHPAADDGHDAHGVTADAHAAHGAATRHGHDASDDEAPGDDAAHPCDCLGTCGLATLVAVPGVPSVRGATTLVVDATPPAPRAPPAVRAVDHLLPFANGPPAVA